jgi:hypothetical protein
MADVNIDTQNSGDNKPWFDGVDDEVKGYITSRGLDKKTEREALLTTIQAHREASAKIGIPADRVLKLPDEGDAEGWKNVWQKLGVPQDIGGYDVSKLNDDKLATLFKQQALALNIPKAAAERLAEQIAAYQFETAAEAKTQDNAKLANAMQELRNNWGVNFETNKFVADRAATLMGISAEALNVMANSAGFPTVMEGLRKMGMAMGEGKLIGLGGPGDRGLGPMTAEEAKSQRTDLINNADFYKRWRGGDKAAIDQLANLDKIITQAAFGR